MTTDLIDDDRECVRKDFTARVGTPINPDSDVDVECYMTTTSVDADDEVMLPGGIDLSRYAKNPVVLLMHSLGQPGTYGLPVGKALWTKQVKNGVMAGVRFARDTEMGRQVKALFDEGMLNAFSVGFRPLEATAMTRKEAESRADWSEAYTRTKGHIRVHRKWLMVELSVVGVPSNPDALVTTYKAKGILVPSWLNLKSPEAPMDNDEPEVDDEEKACDCGKADCPKCKDRVQTKDEEEGDDEDDLEEKAVDDEDFEVDAPEIPDDDEFDEEDEAELPIKTRDHVDIKSKGFKGCGVVEKIHRKGLVDHVDEDVMGTKDDPAARVQLYKAHGDGHAPTERRMGVAVKCLSRRAEPFKAPSKKSVSVLAETKGTESPGTLEPLPPLVALSDSEIAQRALKQIDAIPSTIEDYLYKLVGGV